MSWEAWGTPPDPQPNPCALCDEELGSSGEDCKLCAEFNHANKAASELAALRHILAHRLRILKTRNVYEGAKKENGVSVELLQAITLLSGIPGVLFPHETDPRLLAEAEKALLTMDNAYCMYSTQPGCTCHFNDKPHPVIHAEDCGYRIKYGPVWGIAASGQTKGRTE